MNKIDIVSKRNRYATVTLSHKIMTSKANQLCLQLANQGYDVTHYADALMGLTKIELWNLYRLYRMQLSRYSHSCFGGTDEH